MMKRILIVEDDEKLNEGNLSCAKRDRSGIFTGQNNWCGKRDSKSDGCPDGTFGHPSS